MVELKPSAGDLAALLVRMTELEWPTSEEERLSFFDLLELHDVGDERSEPATTHFKRREFATSLPGSVTGLATTFRGEFVGVSLFVYNEPIDNGELARAGYAELRQKISARLGQPIEEWGTDTAPCCLWKPGPLSLDMYCFQRAPSGIMVGPDHAERSKKMDAASEDTAPQRRERG